MVKETFFDNSDAQSQFDAIFTELDVNSNGTLDRNEAFTLIQKWDKTKKANVSLKKYLFWILVASGVVIVLLSAAVFGASYAAAQAAKDVKVDESGKMQSTRGKGDISTIAHGTRFKFLNTSDDTPLCVTVEDFEALQGRALDGEKVMLDVEQQDTNEHDIVALGNGDVVITGDTTCFPPTGDGQSGMCFTKENCLSTEQRRLQESRGLQSWSGYTASRPNWCKSRNAWTSSCRRFCKTEGGLPTEYGEGWWPYNCGRYGTYHTRWHGCNNRVGADPPTSGETEECKNSQGYTDWFN